MRILFWVFGILLIFSQSVSARDLIAITGGGGQPAAQSAPCTPLETLTHDGDVSMKLIGNGTTTSHVDLNLTNNTDHSLTVSIPSGQVFSPANPSKSQYMMAVDDTEACIPAGGECSISALPTVCISSKSTPPPGQSDTYSAGGYPNWEQLQTFRSMVQIAHANETAGRFNHVPIAESRRANTISQLAIWMTQADITSKPQDQITKQSIENDLLRATGTAAGSLTLKQQKQFDDGVNKIFLAADLTCKEAHVATLPPNTLNIDDGQPQTTTPKPREPEVTTGDHGEQITTEFHPDGSKAKRTTVSQPTPGGDPRDPTSETVVAEIVEYDQGQTLPKSRTTITEIRTLQGLDEVKIPKTRTSVTKTWSRDDKGRRYVSEEKTVTESLTEIDDNGEKQLKRTTTTKTRSGPDDKTASESEPLHERYEPRLGGWVPLHSPR